MKIQKKILRRIAEHIIAAQAVNILGTCTDDLGLSDDDLEYVSEHIDKVASKMTVGPIYMGKMEDIVKYWKDKQ